MNTLRDILLMSLLLTLGTCAATCSEPTGLDCQTDQDCDPNQFCNRTTCEDIPSVTCQNDSDCVDAEAECAEPCDLICVDASCIPNTCGNGVIDDDEACDDGFTDACGSCNADCSGSGTGSTCGDGEVCPEDEACDDGYADTCGSCNENCTGTGDGSTCGDGILCPEVETCDDGHVDSCGTCNADCSAEGTGAQCGDGDMCPEVEECDDGNTFTESCPGADACEVCDASCSLVAGTFCGDGIVDVEGGEECDDGNQTDDGNGCQADCRRNDSCGDGILQLLFEVCDDGFTDSCGTCNADCSAAGTGSLCGDAERCPETEVCDDGYTDACGTCNADCSGVGTGATCGDGIVCPELEFCEPDAGGPSDDGCSACNADCSGPGGGACGDGIVCGTSEVCDDGFNDACGTCNADCSGPGTGAVCGDGTVCAELEACDDGFNDTCGTCNATCTSAGTGSTCGDGSVCLEFETCDDGFRDGCGSCNADCDGPGSSPVCGDGSVCPEFELCDDGFTDDCGSCNATCTASGSGSTCGDGLLCPEFEICDDGYTDACGTCNAFCIAPGTGATCGDGIFCPELEICDDGNSIEDDGCTSQCTSSLCGDGLLNQRLLATTSMTFSWAAVKCGGGTSEGVFEINGVEFARATMENDCFCGDVDQSITVTDKALMETLLDGENSYSFRLDPITDTYMYWAKAAIDDTGEEVVIYEQDPGTAAINAPIPCGEGLFQLSPSTTSTAETFGPEPCDDGNLINGDGCDSNCTLTACGNEITAGSEQCDTGGNSDTCNSDCTFTQCGDGKYNVSAGEGCDDGNTNAGDGCSATCQLEYCGDGIVQPALGELCDDGNQLGGDGCSFGCQTEGCGDGSVSAALGETCDDGNTIDNDGCSASCMTECGDGELADTGIATGAKLRWKRSGFACADGIAEELWLYVDSNLVEEVPVEPMPCGEYEAVLTSPTLLSLLNGGAHDIEVVAIGCWISLWVEMEVEKDTGETTVLTLYDPFDRSSGEPGCGDFSFLVSGNAESYGESCDDGNLDAGDGCSASCGIETCGNGILDPNETCDDGNTDSGDGCSNTCAQEGCGDGAQSPTEECDDGNTNDNDGCSSDCLLEECGNGRLDPGEGCDDDNLTSGDGCSSICRVEVCGNGTREVGEGCDDGNTDSGDGCSSICELEGCAHVVDSDGDGLADCVESNTGIYVSTSDTGTNPNDIDSDDDGISDGDEVLGTPSGLNLQGMGASPNRRDIFLEVDWTADDAVSNCGGTELRPTATAMEAVVEAFARAPIQNRDGSTGIALHIDFGQGKGFDGGNLIAGSDSFLNGGLVGDFVNHKTDNFAANREGYFHYAIQAYDFGDGGVSSGAGGLGYTPGYDFLVTQGCPTDSDATTYMHELGHNLNLRHGGFENCNYKPNYNSIMNYLYNYAFRDCGRNVLADLDYSHGVLDDLNENSLNESVGLCDDIAIDWNVDGSIGVVQYNANPQESSQEENCGGTLTILKDHNDWANLVYYGPANPSLLFVPEILE